MVLSYDTAWGFKTEATFGTPIALTSGANWIPFISESLTKTFDYIEVPTTRARIQPEASNLGRETTSGDIEFWADAESIGYPLFYTLGTAATPTQPDSVGAPLVYEHKLSINESAIKQFTSELKYGSTATKGKTVTSCMSTGLSFDYADGGITSTMGVVAQTLNPNATVTAPTYTNFPRAMNFKDSQLDVGTTVDVATFKNATLAISNNIVDDPRQGSQKTQSLNTGLLDVTGSVELTYDTGDTALEDWLNGVEQKDIKLILLGDTIQTTFKYEIRATVPRTWVTSAEISQTQGDLITRNVEFRAFYDYTATPKGLEFLLRNKKSTVYA